ncbi:MarR family winged helix-turn-helix transcriptional regulator [Fulvimonas sp. R45]|nr:MarR family winged helix-turn-helix transcriptional regulator [Fulvimonas sp. R45]
MATKKNVQHAHISPRIRALHDALIRMASVMNRPDVDERLVREAGIALDGALFPLLVMVERFGPIGIVELANRGGRDYTTVSRQVGRLERQGLVERRADGHDARVRAVVVTRKGKAMTDALDAARERMARALFADWSESEVDTLVGLLQRFACGLEAQVSADAVEKARG